MPERLFDQRRALAAIALGTFLLISLFAEYTIRQEGERLAASLRNQTLLQAASVRARIESELNAQLYLANGLSGYVTATATLEPLATEQALNAVFRYGQHLRNIGLAPDNTLRFVHPLKGNEKAIGLYYPDHPQQWPAVQQAIATRTTVLAGPISLIQGGKGLISRTPVFLPDGRYWGIISLVIDSDSLFATVQQSQNTEGFTWALRNKDNDSLIYGQPQLFSQASQRLPISVPGSHWELAMAPAHDLVVNGQRLLILRIGAFTLAGLLAWLVYVVLTERVRVRYIALHDPLTGLPNRRLFDDRLQHAIAQSQRNQQPFALLCIDLDDFKPVNDSHGHRTGDLLLGEIARRINDCVRQSDTFSRIGGDEFMLILPDTSDASGALVVAHKIEAALAEPVFLGDIVIRPSASIGIALYPTHGETAEELIRSVDMAMYRVKQNGKGSIYTLQIGDTTSMIFNRPN